MSPNGRMLLVAVPMKNGFKQFVDASMNSTTGETRITGYSIDVFDEVMKNMPYPVSYQYVPSNVSLESYDKLVNLVRDQVSTVTYDLTNFVTHHPLVIYSQELCAQWIYRACICRKST